MEDFWYGMEMEWKKIANMEYGKIVFHSIPYHALCNTKPTWSECNSISISAALKCCGYKVPTATLTRLP